MNGTLRALLFILILALPATDRHPGQLGQAIRGKLQPLADSMLISKQDLFAPSIVKQFYEQRNYQTAWQETDHQNMESLISTIRNAFRSGLVSSEYHLRLLDSLRSRLGSDHHLLLDILLTDAFFKLADNLKHGRVNQQTYILRQKLQEDRDLISLLQTALNTKTVKASLENTEPQQNEYQELKVHLRERLDEYLAISPSTKNKTLLLSEILKLAINLERWRWEDACPTRYLIVNIPSFTFKLVDDDSVLLYSRVIVGQPGKPTPVLTSTIECIVLYPYWYVPRSIATKELLPQLKQDRSYLETNNFEVLDPRGNRIRADTINGNNTA